VDFLAAESVYRNRALGSGYQTLRSTASIFPGRRSERPFRILRIRAANSRRFDAGGGANFKQRQGSPAMSKPTFYRAGHNLPIITRATATRFRQRQAWGQAAFGKRRHCLRAVRCGAWSPKNQEGVWTNRSEALPMTIDPQYTVGFQLGAGNSVSRVAKETSAIAFWLGGIVWEKPRRPLSRRVETPRTSHWGSPGNGGRTFYNFRNQPIAPPTPSGVQRLVPPPGNYSFKRHGPDVIVKAAFRTPDLATTKYSGF